jgi:hypothetical protein
MGWGAEGQLAIDSRPDQVPIPREIHALHNIRSIHRYLWIYLHLILVFVTIERVHLDVEWHTRG